MKQTSDISFSIKENEWARSLVRKSAACAAMLEPAMTLPAHALGVDFFNRSFVATDAVGLKHFFAMTRERDCFRYPAGIKYNRVFHAVYGFPDVIGADIFVGKMAVDAFDATMCAGMKPSLKLGLHDMAGSAEVWSFCFGHEFGGAEHREKTRCCSQDYNCKKDF
jgi:hypothetical protein